MQARRVLFLNPAKTDGFNVSRIHMGFTLLASILKSAGHEVRVIDYAFLRSVSRHVKPPTVEETIKDFSPDVIGISVFTYLFDECQQLIGTVSACTQAPIVLGGPHLTFFPNDFSSDARISYIVRGEAESGIVKWVESAKREPAPVLLDGPLPLAETIPAACLDVVHGSERLANYQIQLSRGCPYRCSFCNIYGIAGRRVRARNLGMCIEEIVNAKRSRPNINSVVITDDCPTFDPGRFKQFLRMFREANTGCALTIDNLRADSLDEELVALYKAAGGVNICLGVESGHPEVLHLASKGKSLEKVRAAAILVHKYGLSLGLCFVIGLPEDTLKRHMQSMRLARELKPDYVFWNMFLPWPGTEAEQWYRANGWIGDVRNSSTLIDHSASFQGPTCDTPSFPKKQRIMAWLMANMENHNWFNATALRKLFWLTCRYGTYKSFVVLLFHRIRARVRSILRRVERRLECPPTLNGGAVSRVRWLTKALLPPVVVAAVRWAMGRRKRDSVQVYLSGGRVPWSAGYGEYRRRFIAEVLADDSLVGKFRNGEPLPAGYGLGLDERCVEYPWLLAQLNERSERMLDAGSALNHQVILDQPAFRRKNLHILTLAPEGTAFWHRGISYLFGDLRDIPIRSDYYDVIACISTLEHVGYDNTMYTRRVRYVENRPDDYVRVMQELRRVLRSGGTLFLSVPFGVSQDFGTSRQFDQQLLAGAMDAFGPVSAKAATFFRYGAGGWERAEEQSCAACEYVEWITRPRDKWPVPLPVEPDHAAAARAVACVRLVKA